MEIKAAWLLLCTDLPSLNKYLNPLSRSECDRTNQETRQEKRGRARVRTGPLLFEGRHSPCLCRRPRHTGRRPGRGFRRRCAPAGEPAASRWRPEKQGNVYF